MERHNANLLSCPWIPVRWQGTKKKITLQELLCSSDSGDICCTRDDMEFACLQLLAAITQVCFTPSDKKDLLSRLKQPLTIEEFKAGIEGKQDWFNLNHPDTPFMQFRGVKATNTTPMDKLLAGVADGTSKAFINPPGLAKGVCVSCAAIALFNTASNSPNIGGGFKAGLRGCTPITQLILGPDLRQSVWLNVLHEERLNEVMPWYQETLQQRPNYVDKVKAEEKINTSNIGLIRGLLWQPAHFELLPSTEGRCSVCNADSHIYTGFNKEKFNYTVDGIWPHPLSPRTFKVMKGVKEEKFLSFTTTAPGWTHLSSLMVNRQSEKEGHLLSPVLVQARDRLIRPDRLQFVIGGYRNNKAVVLDRRHEFFDLSNGWAEHSSEIHRIIETGLGYKTALCKSLEGIKDKKKGAGVNLCRPAEALYFQQTNQWLHETIGSIDFETPEPTMKYLRQQLKQTVLKLFDQVTKPYCQELKMLKALAMARKSLNKSLAALQPLTSKEH